MFGPLEPADCAGVLTAMPQYYFNIFNDVITMDPEGAELADDEAAHAHAVKQVRSLAADTVMHGHITASDWLEIVDEDRKPITCVRFDEAVEFRPERAKDAGLS